MTLSIEPPKVQYSIPELNLLDKIIRRRIDTSTIGSVWSVWMHVSNFVWDDIHNTVYRSVYVSVADKLTEYEFIKK